MAKQWKAEDLPDLSGKTIVVTGGNSGIGYEAALQFAGKNASVVLACRNVEKAREAASKIKSANPRRSVEVMELDLSKLHFSEIESMIRDIGELTVDMDGGDKQVRIRCEELRLLRDIA